MKENNYKQCSEGLGCFVRFVVIYGKCRIGIKSFLKVSEKIRGKCKRKKLMEENLQKPRKYGNGCHRFSFGSNNLLRVTL